MKRHNALTGVENLIETNLDRFRFRLHALHEPVEYWLWRLGRHGDVVVPISTSDFSFATASLTIWRLQTTPSLLA